MQRGLEDAARGDLTVERLARRAQRRGGVGDERRHATVAVGACGEPLAQARGLVRPVLELRDALLGIGQARAQLTLGQLRAARAALGEHLGILAALGLTPWLVGWGHHRRER